MQLAKVVGTVVATQKNEVLRGVKLVIVQPLLPDGRLKGRPVVAVDGTGQAGMEELVFLIAGREGALVLERSFAPVDMGIVGIVEDLYVVQEAIPAPPKARS
jgi:microcompartment protein CcmK/EutM